MHNTLLKRQKRQNSFIMTCITQGRNSTVRCVNELYLYSLLKTKRQIKRQIHIPLWTHKRHKEWCEDRKTFTRCYTIALGFCDEFNANSVLLHFSSYRSIKIWHLYFKNVEKKAIKQCIKTPKHFNIKKHLALVFHKICPCNFLSIPN